MLLGVGCGPTSSGVAPGSWYGCTKTSRSTACATLPNRSRKRISKVCATRAVACRSASPRASQLGAYGNGESTSSRYGEPGSELPKSETATWYDPETLGFHSTT